MVFLVCNLILSHFCPIAPKITCIFASMISHLQGLSYVMDIVIAEIFYAANNIALMFDTMIDRCILSLMSSIR